MDRYQEYLDRKRRERGERFDPSNLCPAFVRYFNSGERIKVEEFGRTATGTVSVTTGWRPSFLLMRSSRARGSSVLLSDKTPIVAVKRGRKYVSLA